MKCWKSIAVKQNKTNEDDNARDVLRQCERKRGEHKPPPKSEVDTRCKTEGWNCLCLSHPLQIARSCLAANAFLSAPIRQLIAGPSPCSTRGHDSRVLTVSGWKQGCPCCEPRFKSTAMHYIYMHHITTHDPDPSEPLLRCHHLYRRTHNVSWDC